MAIYFEPQRRDSNSKLEWYMMQMAQMYGDKRRATKEQAKVKSFAESISPPDISMINDQRLFSPAGQQIAQDAWLGDDPNMRAELGIRPGQQTLSPQQIMQKALLANLDPKTAAGLAQTLGRQTGGGYTLSPDQIRYGPGGQEIARGRPKQTESQQLQAEGYTSQEIKLIFDIQHGFKARASAIKKLEDKPLPEQLKFWQSLQSSSQGQYFGFEGFEEMKNPEVAELAGENVKRILKEMKGESPESHHPDYPDSFMEDGVWKVIQDGKKYRIEE